MQRIYSFFCCCIIAFLAACSKDSTTSALPAGSISILGNTGSDTLMRFISVERDTVLVVGIKAESDQAVTGEHHIDFGVDATKLVDYQSTYGDARLLPSNAYFFYQPSCSLHTGTTVSDSIEVNIVKGTSLRASSTYVLPVVIRAVDGSTDAIASGQTQYIVIKTGASSVITKAGWQIASVSSQETGGNEAFNLLDNDNNTSWMSSTSQTMPQNVVIDFDDQVTFSGVTYSTPNGYYPSFGGYPTQIRIELSTDGTQWDDKGTFAGQTSNGIQTLQLGTSTARYLRFTVLSVVPLFSAYEVVNLSDINLTR